MAGARRVTAVLVAFVAAGASAQPVPPNLGETDPMIREAVEARLAGVDAEAGAGAWVALAETYDANDYVAEAVACYERALALDPEDGRAWYLLALARHDLGRLGAAMEAMGRAAAIEPGYAPVHWRRGYWLLDDGRLGEAERHFERVGGTEPGRFGLARIALARREVDRAGALLEPLARDSDNRRYAYRLMATVHALSGEREAAALAMSVSEATPPSWSDPWLADVLERRTGYDAGLDRIRRLTEGGRWEEAIGLTTALLERWPEDVGLRNYLGYAHFGAGRRERALEVWMEALEDDPDHYLLHLNVGSLYAEDALRGTRSPAEAFEHLDRALESHPTHARTHLVRGSLLGALGRYEEAIGPLERAFELDPGDANLARQLTQVLLRTGRWAEAERVARRWVLLEPRSAQGHLSLAIALLRQGRSGEASGALEAGAALLPAGHPQVEALRREIEGG